MEYGQIDEGLPIAYNVLDDGVAVMSSDGEQVGTVDHVVAAIEKDIFHGIVIKATAGERRFVEASLIQSLHEFGVDLSIDAAAAALLPAPKGGAAVYNEDPSAQQKGWHHWARTLTLRNDWKRER